jgi:diacylglycerol kinase (ATP)
MTTCIKLNNYMKILSILGESAVTVFFNPTAGGGRARFRLAQIRELFESFQVQAQFVKTNSAAELKLSVQDAVSRKCGVLLAMGGDGTFHTLANAAFGAGVLLGVIPVGGGNDFAAALGLPDDPLKSAEAILQGTPRFVDLMQVRTAEGRTRLYAGGGGIGLDARAIHYSSGSYRWLPGRWRYIASALRALVGFVALEVRVDFPGSELIPHEAKVLLAAVLNTPTYGAGVRLAPQATIDDGLLHVVLIENISVLQILQLLPRLLGSGELRTSRMKRWQVSKVRLTTRNPTVFQGDGEIIGSTPVEIEVIPRAIQVLAPCKD